MEWLSSLLTEHSVIQAVIVVSLVSAVGLALGKISMWGVSLGVTFVFFVGIMAGHFGLSIDPQMLNYAESFGLIIFVYALGVRGGTRFFLFLGKGRAEIEYAGHVGGFVGNRDDLGISLVHGSVVAGYGGNSGVVR